MEEDTEKHHDRIFHNWIKDLPPEDDAYEPVAVRKVSPKIPMPAAIKNKTVHLKKPKAASRKDTN